MGDALTSGRGQANGDKGCKQKFLHGVLSGFPVSFNQAYRENLG